MIWDGNWKERHKRRDRERRGEREKIGSQGGVNNATLRRRPKILHIRIPHTHFITFFPILFRVSITFFFFLLGVVLFSFFYFLFFLTISRHWHEILPVWLGTSWELFPLPATFFAVKTRKSSIDRFIPPVPILFNKVHVEYLRISTQFSAKCRFARSNSLGLNGGTALGDPFTKFCFKMAINRQCWHIQVNSDNFNKVQVENIKYLKKKIELENGIPSWDEPT